MRYIRQKQLEYIPEGFQDKIKDKKIVVVGCGGIGSPLSELLVRGGFLNLLLIDKDKIDETNLQRQIFVEKDIGKYKAKALKKRLLKINKKSNIKICLDELSNNNIKKIIGSCDLILDATDNIATRRLINKYCEKNKLDWIYNGAVKCEIMSCLFRGEEKLFDKIFPKKSKDIKAADVGILASTTFSSASLAYNQTLKYFLEIKDNKLIKINLWENKLFEIKIK